MVLNEQSSYKIFVSANASGPEKHAAEELQQYLFRITGCSLPIVQEANPQEKYVYVGFGEAPAPLLANIKPEAFGNEEYIIRSDGQHRHIIWRDRLFV